MEEEDVMKSVEYRAEIEKARIQLRALMLSNDCAPIMLRLAWSDAATYDKRDGSGGPNGSIRFEEEYSHEVNNGLKIAIDHCEEVKSKHPMITYADLYQLAGVVSVEVTGGPTIDFIHGRRDSTICTREGRLPEPRADEDHLRSWFYRMGLSDRDIVALSGAHTLGRAHNERSGFEGPWTHEPLKFDNSYYVELRKVVGEGLVKLPTDICIIRDPALRKYVLEYSNVCITEYLDQELFFRDYAESHKKFSELGMREKKRAEQRRNAFEVAFGLAVAAAVVVLASIYDCWRIR